VTAGVTRGWDMTFEDNNGAVDGIGNITFKPSDQFSVALNWNTGPQDNGDNGHYRTVLDPIMCVMASVELAPNATVTLAPGRRYSAGASGRSMAKSSGWP